MRAHHRRRISALAFFGSLCAAICDAASTPAAPDAESEPGFQVVVSASNPVPRLTCDEIRRLFTRKSRWWQWGDRMVAVQAVDQVAESQVREAFTHRIFGRSVGTIRTYWQRMHSPIGPPPPELADDAAVLSRVAGEEAAIGYVAADADPGEGARVLEVAYPADGKCAGMAASTDVEGRLWLPNPPPSAPE